MKLTQMRFQMSLLLGLAAAVLLLAVGCDGPSKYEALQQENQLLNERIIELENQLVLADAAASQTPAYTQTVAESVYIVGQGDTLWNIAQKQLGKGTRYKEILAANPGLSENVPLTIGTKIKIPPK